jgi:enterochelin esterase-like enzyme
VKNRARSAYGCLPLRPYLPGSRKGKGDLKQHQVASRILGSREVVVYLPPGYSAKDSFAYPLALLQDGQNIFDPKTAVFGVDWAVDLTAERLIAEQKIRPVILVAVYNSRERVIEYTPFADRELGGGGAARYEEFLIDELLPFLHSEYSLSKRPEDRAVIGSSLGGLLALHLGWTRPRVFGAVGSLSPSLWWGQRGMITSMASGAPPSPRPLIWLDGGTLESDTDDNDNGVPDVVDDLRTMRAVLLSHGYQLEKDLIYRELEGQRHDESAWSSRVGDVLQALFPKIPEWTEG